MQASRHQIMSIAQTIQKALSNVGDVDQQREVLRRALHHNVLTEVRPISWNTLHAMKQVLQGQHQSLGYIDKTLRLLFKGES
jgi:hypothetical protein